VDRHSIVLGSGSSFGDDVRREMTELGSQFGFLCWKPDRMGT
jgi:hypothetical protein